jgi:pimeloyl-ACP methyl ester carboxylesterase
LSHNSQALIAGQRFLAGHQMSWILRALMALQVIIFLALGTWFTLHFARVLTVGGCYLLALVVVLGAHCTVTGIQFLLARSVRGDLAPQYRLSRFGALTLYDREVDASMRGIWWANPFLSDVPLPVPAEPHRELAILCVHGYFCTRAIWLPFARAAVARGYYCQALTIEPPFCSIDSYATQIGDAIDALCAASGSQSLVIVAHSMGALAVRSYLRQSQDARVARLVAIGAPHHGTFLAKFSHATNGRQMRRDSLWLEALNAAETPESLSRITSIYSAHDNIVTPYQTAEMPGADNRLLHGLGHVSLVYAAPVWEQVFDAIERDAQSLPDPRVM